MTTATQEGPSKAHLGFITLSVMLATIMQALDTTIANVALPHMQGAMGGRPRIRSPGCSPPT